MLNLIVVDDESMIRNGIAAFVNNNDFGFNAVETFKDGGEAIEYMKNNNVDLVISDIKMVNVSGIELAKYVYDNMPDTRVILLSGYADFEYARAAIKYNVEEYITKPTNFNDLKNILLKIKDSITNSRKNDINAFFSNVKQLYTDILDHDAESASITLKQLLDSNTRESGHLSQYISNIFEIITDRLQSNLQIELKGFEDLNKSLASAGNRIEIFTMAVSFINYIINQLPGKNKTTDDIVISKLLQFINEHFSENISLQDAAEKVFFNPAYCSRFFKKQTGENFSDYLLKVRMQHAVKLLRRNIKIADISKACGYSSSGYFTRSFKDYYNCTPSEYMRNL